MKMYNIKTIDNMKNAGAKHFSTEKYILDDNIENPDAILLRSTPLHNMTFNNKLIAIARSGVGVNNIPIKECTKHGVCVFNTPGANSNAVKELTICGLILASRKIIESIDWTKTLNSDIESLVEAGKNQFVGPEISGKTLGIIGLGNIGGKVANIAVSLGMNVIGYDPYLSVNSALSLKPMVKVLHDINEVYSKSDYISLHAPCNEETKNYINSSSISKMKDGVKILNFARGELVNYSDLKKALLDGKVNRFITDFPNEEILHEKNVVCIPHLGGSTEESENNCNYMACNELKNYLENGNITNSVNLPNAELSKTGDLLICIIHKNAPSLLSKITTKISGSGANIENLINRSRGEWAYTMVDVTGNIEKDAFNDIEEIVNVRII